MKCPYCDTEMTEHLPCKGGIDLSVLPPEKYRHMLRNCGGLWCASGLCPPSWL